MSATNTAASGHSLLYDHAESTNWSDIIHLCAVQQPVLGSYQYDGHYYTHHGETALHRAVSQSAPPAVITSLVSSCYKATSLQDYKGRTPLHLAASLSGGPATVACSRILVEANPLLGTMVDCAGSTPLYHAVRASSVDVVRLFLSVTPAAAAVASRDGNTPLHAACRLRSPATGTMVRLLLDAALGCAAVTNKEGMTPLHCLLSPQYASFDNTSVETIRLMLEASPVSATKVERRGGNTPLHLALQADAPIEIIRLLIGASNPRTCGSLRNHAGETPLHIACERLSSTEVILALVRACSESDGSIQKEPGEVTPLHMACLYGANVDVVRGVLRACGAAGLLKTAQGDTALHISCRKHAPRSVVQVLLDKCPKAVHLTNRKGFTPLHLACSAGSREGVVPALLEEAPEAVKVTSKNGSSVLHYAISTIAPLDVVQLLILRYPDAVAMTNGHGMTPLHLAVERRRMPSLEIVRALIEAKPEAAMVVDGNGRTPLHFAQKPHVSLGITELLVKTAPQAVHVEDVGGRRPLDLLCLANAKFLNVMLDPDAVSPRRTFVEFWRKGMSLVTSAHRDWMRSEEGVNPQQGEEGATGRLRQQGRRSSQPVVHACLRCVGLGHCPIEFSHLAIRVHPEQARAINAEGNLPLHIIASFGRGKPRPRSVPPSRTGVSSTVTRRGSIPFRRANSNRINSVDSSRTIAYDGTDDDADGEKKYDDSGLTSLLLSLFPEAVKIYNAEGKLPIQLFIESGRGWGGSVRTVLESYPPGLFAVEEIANWVSLFPFILSRVGNGATIDEEGRASGVTHHGNRSAMFELLRGKPDLIHDDRRDVATYLARASR